MTDLPIQTEHQMQQVLNLASIDPLRAPDAAETLLQTARRGNDKADIAAALTLKAEVLTRLNRDREAAVCLEQAQLLTRTIEAPAIEARIMLQHAVVHYHLQKTQDAFPFLRQAEALSEAAGDDIIRADCRRLLGVCHSVLSEHDAALHHLYAALEIYEQHRDDYRIGLTWMEIGTVYVLVLNFELGRLYYDKALNCLYDRNCQLELHIVATRVGQLLIGKAHKEKAGEDDPQLKQAERLLRLCLPYFRRIAQNISTVSTLTNLAVACSMQLRLDEALTLQMEALKIAEATRQTNRLIYCYGRIGVLYAYTGKVAEAVEWIERSLKLSREKSSHLSSIESCAFLSRLHEDLGDTDKALWYQREATRLKKNLLEGRKIHAIDRIHYEREAAKLANDYQRMLNTAGGLHVSDAILQSTLKEQDDAGERHKQFLQSMSAQIRETLRQKGRSGKNTLRRLAQNVHDFLEHTSPPANGDAPNDRAHFPTQLHERFPALTTAELRICLLLASHLDSGQIAIMLGVSQRTIETHRRRIRSKLDLPTHVNLSLFLMRLYAGFKRDQSGADTHKTQASGEN